MLIRKAQKKDIPEIIGLLKQVNSIHRNGRPDLFKSATKYTREQLDAIINDVKSPVLVADDDGKVKGYAFCIFQTHGNDTLFTDIKTLYIDDLCVDEKCRGEHIGKRLYEAVSELAKDAGCYNITLNVWCLNSGAFEFYEKCGMRPLKIYMEQVL